MASWRIAISVLYLLFLAAVGLAKKAVHSPPTIIRHPNPEITLKPGEKVEIPCRATGEPAPSYTWRKNDQPLPISNIDIKQLPGLGTIVIETVGLGSNELSLLEGVYQCIATNNFGKAVGIKTILKKAVLEPFPSLKEPKIHRPIVGMPLTLHCQPPLSYPQSIVYWGESRAEDRLKAIDGTDRITLDYEGNLHFANVLAEDAKGGVSYVCIVQNTELRSLVQGDDQKIDPRPISGAPRYEAPKLMWPLSNAHEVALKGETKKMKCIFSG